MYDSVQKILRAARRDAHLRVPRLQGPGPRRLRLGDRPWASRRRTNIHVGARQATKDAFVTMRTARDATLGMPKLIIPSLQVNMRAGEVPTGRRRQRDAQGAGQQALIRRIEGELRWTPRPSRPPSPSRGQITAADVPALADRGFRSIICNRPDGEGPDQPTFEEIEAAAQDAGLAGAATFPSPAGMVTRRGCRRPSAARSRVCRSRCLPTAAPARARPRSGRCRRPRRDAVAGDPRRDEGRGL